MELLELLSLGAVAPVAAVDAPEELAVLEIAAVVNAIKLEIKPQNSKMTERIV